MGGACSKGVVVDDATMELDKQLERERIENALNFKVLVLGAGESGKSTVVTQLKILYKKEKQSEAELEGYLPVLKGNCAQSIAVFVKQAREIGVEMSAEEKKACDELEDLESSVPDIPQSAIEAFKTFRASKAFEEAWAKRNGFWHLEASLYYFDNFERYVTAGEGGSFKPTDEDIIFCRKRTTGVVLTDFKYSSVDWTVVDVGGQRNERRKWMHFFDNVKAIIYVVNLAGYCKVLFEDSSVNRMHEALNLFEDTVKNATFKDTPIFLFLNKKDLFEKCIQEKQPLTHCFPEYKGTEETQPCLDYIAEKFQERLPAGKPRAEVNYMASRFKRDVKYAFEEVRDVLMSSNKKAIDQAVKTIGKIDAKADKEQKAAAETS